MYLSLSTCGSVPCPKVLICQNFGIGLATSLMRPLRIFQQGAMTSNSTKLREIASNTTVSASPRLEIYTTLWKLMKIRASNLLPRSQPRFSIQAHSPHDATEGSFRRHAYRRLQNHLGKVFRMSRKHASGPGRRTRSVVGWEIDMVRNL